LWGEIRIFKRIQEAKKNFSHVAIILQSSKLEINTIELRNKTLLSIGGDIEFMWLLTLASISIGDLNKK